MAKSTKVVQATAPFTGFLYNAANDMPWEKIEATMGKVFCEQARNEIHRCTACYSAHTDFVRGAAPAAEVRKLQKKFLEHAQGLVDLADKYRPKTGPRCSEDDETVFLAVALSSTKKNFDLTSTMKDLDGPCRAIVDALSDKKMNYDESAQYAEVVGLAHFIAEALKGATRKRARAAEGGKKPATAYDYHRWGLHLGAKSKDLRAFAAAVLDRPVTKNQIRHAFEVAREQDLLPRPE